MNIHQRIKTARENAGFDQAGLGKACGVSQQAVQKWESKGTPRTATISKIAALCGVSIEWVMNGEGTRLATIESNISPIDMGRIVPVISFVQAGDWAECIDNFQIGDAEEWLPCPTKHSNSTFAVYVRGDSMTSNFGRSYPEGCIIFVDPERESRSGDRVIAKLTDVNEATFKVLVEDAGVNFLRPLNQQYPTLQINGNCKIIGKVIGSYIPE